MQRKNYKNRNNTISIIFTILLISAFSLLVNMQALAQYKKGTLAPDFTLEALDGESYQLNQFNNKKDHLLLCFVKNDDSNSINKLQNLIAFFEDYQPRESYQIIAVVEPNNGLDNVVEGITEYFFTLQENTKIPLLVLLDKESKVVQSYQIERFPTFLLLRADLHVRRAYENFTRRQEDSFYQYLGFIFTSQESSDSSSGSSGCDDDDGVCPPPPGY